MKRVWQLRQLDTWHYPFLDEPARESSPAHPGDLHKKLGWEPPLQQSYWAAGPRESHVYVSVEVWAQKVFWWGKSNTITLVSTRKKKEICLFLLYFTSASGKGCQGPGSLQDIANKTKKRLGKKNLVAAANGSLNLLSTCYVPGIVLIA